MLQAIPLREGARAWKLCIKAINCVFPSVAPLNFGKEWTVIRIEDFLLIKSKFFDSVENKSILNRYVS